MNIAIDKIVPAHIDETPQRQEKPENLALRLSQQKALALKEGYPTHHILAADTVVACGQNILDKAKTSKEAHQHLQKLSGRRHHVHGGISLLCPDGTLHSRKCKTMVQFKPLSPQEIEAYIATDEWEGKAGAYAIQGFAGAFVKYMAGSYSNVVGLSLYDTMKLMDKIKSTA